VAGFLDVQRRIQAELRASLEVSETDAVRLQRLLAAWDWMSLVLCRDDLPATVESERAINLTASGPGAVALAPWPFGVESLEVAVDARRLEGRFEDEDRMREALAAAPWQRLGFSLTPA
jgi:hypothetical protein